MEHRLDRIGRILFWVVPPLMVAALFAAFIYAPTEIVMGNVQRIFYFHVPSAWVSFLAFLVTCVYSIAYLRSKNRRHDAIALSSVEIGIVFTTIAIITGSLWARPVWNTWWTWDPRLSTMLILWLIYVAYLMLRGAIEDEEQRARFSAVLGIIGFLDVPIVFMAIRWWRTIHPVLIGSASADAKGQFNMEPQMVVALLLGITTFTLLYWMLLARRVSLEETTDRVAQIKKTLADREAD
ncbi:MAG: cytochrome c biogenesis protein CcsA [Chloroflexi bacterium]|nr:cytochrome c biogenesis protein CcsA [Chloroflexota bacterium]